MPSLYSYKSTSNPTSRLDAAGGRGTFQFHDLRPRQPLLASLDQSPLNSPKLLASKALQQVILSSPKVNQTLQLRTQLPHNPVSNEGVVQMVKYVRRSGKVYEVPDTYVKKSKERWAEHSDYLANPGGISQAAKEQLALEAEAERQRAEQEELARIEEEARLAEEARIQAIEAAKMQRLDSLYGSYGPKPHTGKQISFPKVYTSADKPKEASLIYRGMSMNNIKNLRTGGDAIFTAQNPMGQATAEDHIVKDDPNSPYLSFEADGLGISAGKYAAKPVDPQTLKPLGVVKHDDGFLKQEKSYAAESRRKFSHARRIGMVGGIDPAGKTTLDYSTEAKAASLSDETAKKLAIADKEVLVKPGADGVRKEEVPFLAKVQEVDEAYYKKHIGNQTSRKTLGYYKAHGKAPTFHKIQLANDEVAARYGFHVPKDELRHQEADEDEMSDIEDINLSDYQ